MLEKSQKGANDRFFEKTKEKKNSKISLNSRIHVQWIIVNCWQKALLDFYC